MVELLLEHGADVNAKDNNGLTPLQATASGLSCIFFDDLTSAVKSSEGLKDVAEFLRQHGGQE